MNKVARVIVTYECNRSCENCCNEYIGIVPQVQLQDLLKYDEIVITGGEPMLIAPRVVEMIHRLKESNYQGKIWLYTASMSMSRWADRAVLKEVDGITYTLHFEPTIKELRDVCKLSQYIAENLDNGQSGRSDRILIDSRAWNDEILGTMGIKTEESRQHWFSVKPLEWKNEECPLAEGEELVFHDLEAE